MEDKLRELRRYDDRALHLCEVVQSHHEVLELAAGTGVHTGCLLDTGALVTASDISANSLEVLVRRFPDNPLLRTCPADIEHLPFDDGTFDAVTCAGSLSYGDPGRVDAEVLRVLRRGGCFVCVDSLNHNVIYQLNRWVHYLWGDRTKSTLVRMPTMERIASIASHFTNVETRFFGTASWALGPISRMCGEERAARFSDLLDRQVGTTRSAFKFVMVARGRV